MVFITIMTRGAARFSGFSGKTSNERIKTPVVSHFRNPTKMGRQLIKLLQKAQQLIQEARSIPTKERNRNEGHSEDDLDRQRQNYLGKGKDA